MRHKLVLKRETLTELTPDAMRGIVGGALSHLCIPTDRCTEPCGHGPTFDQACPVPTNPVNQCLSIPSCIQTA